MSLLSKIFWGIAGVGGASILCGLGFIIADSVDVAYKIGDLKEEITEFKQEISLKKSFIETLDVNDTIYIDEMGEIIKKYEEIEANVAEIKKLNNERSDIGQIGELMCYAGMVAGAGGAIAATATELNY